MRWLPTRSNVKNKLETLHACRAKQTNTPTHQPTNQQTRSTTKVAKTTSNVLQLLNSQMAMCMNGREGQNVYLVTGANAGLGKEACRQLAMLPETYMVYMACRSSDRAHQAIDDLVKKHGCPKEKLQFFHFDANETKEEIDKAVEKSFSVSSVNGSIGKAVEFTAIILNAGGFGDGSSSRPTGPNGVLPIVQLNLIGHIQLVQALHNNKHLPNGCRIIFSGSEAARGVPSFWSPAPVMGDTDQEVRDIMTGVKKFRIDIAYSYVKGIGILYFAALARRHPEWKVYTVSPGGTMGTSFISQKAVPLLMGISIYLIWIVSYYFLGKFQSLEDGAYKYVQAVRGDLDSDYASGSFLGCSVDLAGPLCEQTSRHEGARQYADKQKQEVAYEVLQSYL